jgi:hypothetical protein
MGFDEGTDIFSRGSIFYTIVTGHGPYKSNDASEGEDKWQYEERVIALLEQVRTLMWKVS